MDLNNIFSKNEPSRIDEKKIILRQDDISSIINYEVQLLVHILSALCTSRVFLVPFKK